MGTELYHKTIRESHDRDGIDGNLMERVWSPTPWMIDVHDDGRDREIRNWLCHNFGRESSPIHRMDGVWHRGNVTMYGYTWYGFATEEMMTRFIEKWGATPPSSEGE